jgi:hypothetical protein
MTCYISLGSDCSVSYQLRALGLQNYGSMPFDWMLIQKLESVCDILASEFMEFTHIDNYITKVQNDKFDNCDSQEYKSLKKLVHKRYGFTLPHEFIKEQIDMLEFENKYSRRIARFQSICKNESIQKVFIRLGNSKEKGKITKLDDILGQCGYSNYEVKWINVDDFQIGEGEVYTWQRNYLPWNTLLS